MRILRAIKGLGFTTTPAPSNSNSCCQMVKIWVDMNDLKPPLYAICLSMAWNSALLKAPLSPEPLAKNTEA